MRVVGREYYQGLARAPLLVWCTWKNTGPFRRDAYERSEAEVNGEEKWHAAARR
jgi:hypothetical protein